MKKLFLSHYSKHAKEVHLLAEELRFRGIVPWVDKQRGGFSIADDSAAEAERAIEEDCFGLLLYATPDVFGRPFITHHEVGPALRMKKRDPKYAIFAVPRKLKFSDLANESLRVYGHDLSKYHTRPIRGSIEGKLVPVAGDVVQRVIAHSPDAVGDEVGIQFSTIESAPLTLSEVLFIDGRSVYRPCSPPSDFERLVAGMREAKREVTDRYGRARIRVEGMKHLSAAFAFGRIFQPFELNIHQAAGQYWRSDAPFTPRKEFTETLHVATGSEVLAVQISSRNWELSADVDATLGPKGPFSRLILKPPAALDVDNELCCALVDQAYHAIEMAVMQARPSEIHIFAAAPQSLMMMLGKKFAGMRKTFSYDFRDGVYGHPRPVPAGPL